MVWGVIQGCHILDTFLVIPKCNKGWLACFAEVYGPSAVLNCREREASCAKSKHSQRSQIWGFNLVILKLTLLRTQREVIPVYFMSAFLFFLYPSSLAMSPEHTQKPTRMENTISKDGWGWCWHVRLPSGSNHRHVA